MAKIKSTVVVDTDIILKAGDVRGGEDLRKTVGRELQNELKKVKPVVADPDVSIKLDEPGLRNIKRQVTDLRKRVDRAVAEGVDQAGKEIAPKDATVLRATQKRLAALSSVLDTRFAKAQGVRDFNDPTFQRALRFFQAGEVTDRNGRTLPVNRQTLPYLTKIQDQFGKQIFPPDTLKSLEAYSQHLGVANKQLGQYQALATSITGGVGKGGTVPLVSGDLQRQIRAVAAEEKALQARLGGVTERKPGPSDIQRARNEQAQILRQMRQARDTFTQDEIRSVRDASKARLAEWGVSGRKERLARIRDQKRIQRDLARQEEVAVKKLGERKEVLGRRAAIRAGEREGFGVIASSDPARLKSLRTNLEQEAKLIRKRQDQLSKTVIPPGNERAMGRARARARRLEVAYDKVSTSLHRVRGLVNQIHAGTLPGTAPRAGAARTPTQAEIQSQSVKLGREAFQAAGGFGGAAAVPRGQLEDLVNFHKESIKGIKRYRAAIDESMPKNAARIRRLNKELGFHQVELNKASERMRGFGTVTQQTGSLFRQFFRYAIGYGALYQALAAVRALVVGVLELDTALKGIQAIAAATADEMVTIEVGIKRVALTTQFTAAQIAKAAQVLSQAGVIPKELPSAIEATALFASATGSAIELSADLITSMRNVFDTVSDKSLSNLLTRAINISKLTAADLKTVISLSSQVAKTYNFSAEQYLAAVTTLRNVGIKPSTVATGLRQGLLELFSPDSKTAKALVARYKQLGEAISTDEVRDRFFSFSVGGNPLVDALRELQRIGFAGEGKKLFQRAFDVRARNVITALIENLDDVERNAARLTFGSAAMVAANTQMEALSHSLSNLGAAISVFAHDLSSDLLPGIEGWADGLTDVIQKLDETHLSLTKITGSGLGKSFVEGLVGFGVGAAYATRGFIGRAVQGLAVGTAAATLSTNVRKRGAAETSGEGAEETTTVFFDVIQTGIILSLPFILRTIKQFAFGAGFRDVFPKITAHFAGGVVAAAKVAVSGAKTKVMGALIGLSISKAVGGVFAPITLALGSLASLPILKSIIAFSKNHPIIRGITLAYAAMKAFDYFFGGNGKKTIEARLKAASVIREKSEAELSKLTQDIEEFTASNIETGRGAAVGSTAETLERLQQSREELGAGISSLLNISVDRIKDLSELFIKISASGAEKGSDRQRKLFDELSKAIGGPRQITAFGVDGRLLLTQIKSFNAYVNQSQAIAQSMRRYISQLRESEGPLNAISEALVQATDEVLNSSDEAAKIFFNLDTGLDPDTLSKKTLLLVQQISARAKELAESSDEYIEAQNAQIKARTDEAVLFLERFKGVDPDNAEFKSALLTFLGSMEDLSAEQIDSLLGRSASIDDAVDMLKKKAGRFDQLTLDLVDVDRALRGQPPYQAPGKAYPEGATMGELRTLRGDIADELSSLSKNDRMRARIELRQARAQQEVSHEAVARAEGLAAEDAARKKDAEVRKIEEIRERAKDKEFLSSVKQAFPKGTSEESTRSRKAVDAILGTGPAADLLRTKKGEVVDAAAVPGVTKAIKDLFEFMQVYLKRQAETDYTFKPTREGRTAVRVADTAARLAERSKQFDLLAKPGPDNLYNKRRDERNRLLQEEIVALERQLKFDDTVLKGTEAEFKIREKIAQLKYKKEDNTHAAEEAIAAAAIKVADASKRSQVKNLNDQQSALRLKLAGLRKQAAIALDSGDLLKASELDKEIVGVKEDILALQLKKLKLTGSTDAQLAEAEANARKDMISILSKPSVLRQALAGAKRVIDRVAPRKVRLDAEDAERSGFLEQQGKVPSAEDRRTGFQERIDITLEKLRNQEEVLRRLKDFGPLDETSADVIELRENLRLLRTEIGRLKGEAQDELGLEGVGAQLDKGFDLENVGNKMLLLNSSMRNLGNTIQDDIVTGLDGISKGFADALVEGESFTDGIREGFSDMLKAIASDIIQSGIVTLIGSFLGTVGGTTLAASLGFKRGGVVEAKAKGGMVGTGGGVVRGPGTGTSDSVAGVVVDSSGRPTRGIKVSDGEGILTAKATRGIGSEGVGILNSLTTSALESVLDALRSVRTANLGGRKAPSVRARQVMDATGMVFTQPALRMASGGIVGDAARMTSKTSPKQSEGGVEYNYNASISVGAAEGSDVDPDTLRQLDKGITLKIQDYIQDQMRPGGILQSSRTAVR